MRIVILLDHMEGGGVRRWAVNLSSAMVKAGHEVEIHTLRDIPPIKDGVPRSVTFSTSRLKNFKNPLSMAIALFRVRRYLREVSCDCIISAKPVPNALAVLLSLGMRSPLILTEHSKYNNHATPPVKRVIFWLFHRLLYRFSGCIVAVSQDVKAALVKAIGRSHQGNIHVIPNPVITSDMERTHRLSHSLASWFGKGKPPVILAVGRLDRVKNFPLLLSAFALLRKKHKARLLILGEGKERSMLERMANELNIVSDVALPGFVADPYAFMQRARMLVISSDTEGLPTVAIEALACGCPVISTRSGSGIEEILGQGAYGTLVPTNDVEALAQAMRQQLRNPQKSKVLAFRKHKAADYRQENAWQHYSALLGSTGI